jgi:hypothetical protein
MYCRHCGKEVLDKAVVCSGCGHPIEDAVAGEPLAGHPWNPPLFVALIALALTGPLGIVFGILGLMEPAKKVQGAVLLTIGILLTLFWGAALWGF